MMMIPASSCTCTMCGTQKENHIWSGHRKHKKFERDNRRRMTSTVSENAQASLDALAKPVGSLGRLESLIVELSEAQQCFPPITHSAAQHVIIFAGDHGVNKPEEGKDAGPCRVSAFPSTVTVSMVHTITTGKSTISALAKSAGATLELVNVGVSCPKLEELSVPVQLDKQISYVHRPVALGTKDFEKEAAMSEEELQVALALGAEAVKRAVLQGKRVIAVGELGIGNTASASAIAALILGKSAEDLVGPGTGVDSAGMSRKTEVVHNSLARCRKRLSSSLSKAEIARESLRQLGGFELAAMAGCYMECARSHVAVLVDGFIASAAALAATGMDDLCRKALIFATASKEPGHRAVLEAIGVSAPPLLDWGLRLGEGSGAALCLPLVQSAGVVLSDVATLQEVMSSATEM